MYSLINNQLSERQQISINIIMLNSNNLHIVDRFINEFKTKIIRHVEQKHDKNQKLTHTVLYEYAANILELGNDKNKSQKYQAQQPFASNCFQVIKRNQQIIIDKTQQIESLKKKICLQDQLNYSFFKILMKQSRKENTQGNNSCLNTKNCIFNASTVNNNSEIKKTQNCLQVPTLEIQSRTFLDGIGTQSMKSICKTPAGDLKNLDLSDSGVSNQRSCLTDRTEFTSCKSRLIHEKQQEIDQKQKNKALARLLKLEKFVYEKQNHSKKNQKIKNIWNYEIQSNKNYIKDENDSLKAIQSNLITHLSLLQKFRDIPSIEGLVLRQQAVKKKQKFLSELSDGLIKKQTELNKKHSQLLKYQKSFKKIL